MPCQGGPLKSLRELLHAGERLGVETPATEALRARIRQRQWEESARRALGGKTSLNTLAGVWWLFMLHFSFFLKI